MLQEGSAPGATADTKCAPTLLAADELEAVAVYNEGGRAPHLIVCDHAANRVPRSLARLGLDAVALGQHIAWDIGALDIAKRLADRLDAPLVHSSYSRLVCDLNRYPGDPAFAPEQSDGTPIPGNKDLQPAGLHRRYCEIFVPYHETIAARLDAFEARSVVPTVLSIHTCTDRMNSAWRPWPISLSYAQDRRISTQLIKHLKTQDVGPVGDNEPYSVDIGIDFTVCEHAMRRGLAYLQVEFRQDLIGTSALATDWADRFLPSLLYALEDPAVYQRQVVEYPSFGAVD
ncbi:MAG: N-formylglutamate amidohydrolase [Pseudomonadota bacterium]